MMLIERSFQITDTEVTGVYRVSKPVAAKLAVLASGQDLIVESAGGRRFTDSKYAISKVWESDGESLAEFVTVRDAEMTDERAEESWFGSVDADLRNAGWK